MVQSPLFRFADIGSTFTLHRVFFLVVHDKSRRGGTRQLGSKG